jgi:DNA-binding CsgD family transcriptional regulator
MDALSTSSGNLLVESALNSELFARGPLGDRLRAERHRLFVGRSQELALFRKLLLERGCAILFCSGQVGVGKTSLLLEFERICAEGVNACARIDARDVARSSQAKREALGASLAARLLAAGHARPVLLIDSYERIGEAASWLLEECIPNLPSEVLLVIASRQAPPLSLSLDPGWARLVERHELLPLTEPEAHELLERRGISRLTRAGIVDATAGYPLGLAIVAEQVKRSRESTLSSQSLREAQHQLARLICPGAMSVGRRVALDVCGLSRVTTVELLTHVLKEKAARAEQLFSWLSRQSFVEHFSGGIRPHQLARAVLVSRARRESRDRYDALYRSTREFWVDQLAAGQTQESGLVDLFYLDRDLPLVRKLADPEREGRAAALEPARKNQFHGVVELIRTLEGERSSELAAERFNQAPEEFEVVGDDSLDRVLHRTELTEAVARDWPEQDPAKHWIRKFVSANPLAEHDRAVLFRWFMDRDHYQTPCPPVFAISGRQTQLIMAQKGLSYSLCVYRKPQDWALLFASCRVPWKVVGRFELGAHSYALVAFSYRQHSLRDLLVDAWQVPAKPDSLTPPDTDEEPTLKVRRRVDELGQKAKLTAREVQILEMLCLGDSFEQIATRLRIRPRTVKFHQQNLLRKTGATSRVELFRLLL